MLQFFPYVSKVLVKRELKKLKKIVRVPFALKIANVKVTRWQSRYTST